MNHCLTTNTDTKPEFYIVSANTSIKLIDM